MPDALIVDAVRTPVGRYGGVLRDVRPDDLAAHVVRELIRRTHIDPNLIEDVIFGAGNQAGEDNRNVARMVVLLAGLPVAVAGQTGTAEAPPSDDHSWYVSWAPFGHPKVVVVVMIEHGGFGAEAAAPAAREIYKAFFHLK